MNQAKNSYQHQTSNVRINQATNSKYAAIERRSLTMQTAFVVAFCLVMLVLVGIPLYQSYSQMQVNQDQYQQAQAENRQVVENNRLIQREYQKFIDPDYLEEIARRDYYYSKNGEIIFILPEEDTTVNY